MTSGKFDINGWPLWYEKFGTGTEIVLLIGGAMGTGRSDFMAQLEGPNAFDLKKYTFIAVELPGWGRSRPPKRPYGLDVYYNDTDCCKKLMENLGFTSYSVIGWSDGAKVAALMAIKHSSRIKCVVAIGIFVRVTRKTIAPTIFTRDTKKWPKELYDNYLPVYGSANTMQLIWDDHINFCKEAYDKIGDKEEYLTHELHLVRCPVLMVHGDKDPLIGVEHPLYCKEQIADSRLHRFPEGSHNCHQQYPSEFRKIVDKFFDDCNSDDVYCF